MIHFAIGTKAQLIKTAPVMHRLAERGIAYRYIDLGQHSKTTAKIRRTFNLREPDVHLGMTESENVVSLKDAARWASYLVSKALKNSQESFRRVFHGLPGVCVIHGDTLSAFFGLLIAKRAGIRVCHLEAGLTSRHLFHPFPEEIVRRICMKYADHLVAPSDWAYENLVGMGYGPKTFRTSGNTGAETVADILNGLPARYTQEGTFALVSIHRFETIMSKRRLGNLVRFFAEVSTTIPVRFVLHEPTERSLRRYRLLGQLSEKAVMLIPSLEYLEFLRLLQAAEFVMTDGGSVQEECTYLGKPCLLLRKRTERMDGLGANVCLSGLEPKKLQAFVENYTRYRRPSLAPPQYPSGALVDFLIAEGYA